MKPLAKAVTRYPKVILACIIALTLFFSLMIMNLEVEADITKAIPSDLPEMIYLDYVNEIFPKQEFIIVGVSSEDLFTPGHIALLDELTGAFSQLPGVGQVMGPTNLDLIRSVEGGIEVFPILEHLPRDTAETEQFREEITTNRLYKGTFISSDENTAIILIQIEDGSRRETMIASIKAIISSREKENSLRYRIAGEGATLSEVKTIITKDLMVLSPLVSFVLLFVLFLSFRNVRGVLLPILAVIISVIWTLGIMSILHVPLSIMTTVVPTILIAIGSAYGIHIINRFMSALENDREQAIVETIEHTGTAVFMAGLTTMAGFLSFLSSHIDMIREFGIFTAIGVLCALIFSLTFISVMLYLLPVPKRRRAAQGMNGEETVLGRVLSRTGDAVFRQKAPILLISVLLLVFSVSGVFRLRVESDLVQMFGTNSKVMQDNEFFNENFAGTMTMQIIFESSESDSMKNPEVLKAIQGVQEYALTFDFVGGAQSLADMVVEMNRIMRGENQLPDSKRLISQYLLLYSITGDESTLENLVNFDFSMANLTLFVKSSNLTAMQAFEKQMEEYIDEHIVLQDLSVSISGRITALSVLSELIVDSQLLSIIISLLLVFLITAGIFRSVLLGLISTVPIMLTIGVNFALMGWLDIPLDIATVLIASVAIGIGIDYNIHYISHYTYERKEGKDVREAVRNTNSTTGKAIIYNAVSVGAGFLVLIFASLASVGILGVMIAVTMGVSSLLSLTLIPTILILMEHFKSFGKPVTRELPDPLRDLEKTEGDHL